MKSNKIMWGLVALLCLTTIAVSSGSVDSYLQKTGGLFTNLNPNRTPPAEIKDNRDLTKYGMVVYDAPPIADQIELDKRKQKNQRYDNQEWVYKTITNPRTAGVGKVTDVPPPPLFPVEESSIIVSGEVVSVATFLSNDKRGVYSEFTIKVDDLLKSDGASKDALKDVVVDREGGVVVYPNGQRVLYQSSERTLPKLGSKYIFFMTKDSKSTNYKILASYAIDGDSIWQMEIGRPFDEFKNANKATFLEVVRAKLARPTDK